jgi:predicted metal-dependent hydrolase
MTDDKKKIGQPDRNLISFKEKYEFDYAAKQLQKQVEDTTRQEAKDALTKAAKKVSPSEGREKVMRAARKILRRG